MTELFFILIDDDGYVNISIYENSQNCTFSPLNVFYFIYIIPEF